MTDPSLRLAADRLRVRLSQAPWLVSVGIGVAAKQPTILVYVRDKAAFAELPKTWEGFAVRGRVIGDRRYGEDD